jgi:hypothetical protein
MYGSIETFILLFKEGKTLHIFYYIIVELININIENLEKRNIEKKTHS